jgi:hypothetical protein
VVGLYASTLPLLDLHLPVVPVKDLAPPLGAAGIALVSRSSAMLTGRSFAAKHHYEIDVDREFAACSLSRGENCPGHGVHINFPSTPCGSWPNLGSQPQLRRLGPLA